MRKWTLLILAGLVVIPSFTTVLADDDDDDDREDWRDHRYEISGGEISFHLGVFEPRGESDLWRENHDFQTQDISDFDDAIGGVAFAAAITRHLDIQIGGEYYDASTRVRYKDIFTVDGEAIHQTHRLRLAPVDVSFKFFPVSREVRRHRSRRRVLRPVVPYLGGGGGALLWNYREEGRFVDDLEDPTFVFFDKRNARGITGSLHALAGVEVQFAPEFSIWFEGRYRWAKDDLGSDFPDRLDRFDLSGGSLTAGCSFRFGTQRR